MAALLPLVLLGTSGCQLLPWWKPKLSPAEVKRREKHRKLEEKALAGDRKAARELVKWHYLHDSDTQKVQYWLRVAENNGDKNAGRALRQMEGWQ